MSLLLLYLEMIRKFNESKKYFSELEWGKAGQESLDSCDWEIIAEQRVLSRLSLALLADILSSV